MLNPTPQTALGYRVFSLAQYQQAKDIETLEIFMVYIKDFESPDEYSMRVFDGKEWHQVEANQEQLDKNNLTALDFIRIAADELNNKLAVEAP